MVAGENITEILQNPDHSQVALEFTPRKEAYRDVDA
jgi:hypothetical protein